MSTEKCATADKIQCWEDIDFHKAEKFVKKLQRRIALAYQNDEHDLVDALQHKMIHSFYPKALAVKHVTSSKGKSTSGVDDILWSSSLEKYEAISQMNRRGYTPLPLKRVYIPKGNGGVRPLGIPTMKDRAMQTLYRFTLEPIAWLTADEGSFAYLPERGAKRAIARVIEFLSSPDAQYVVKTDIASCFDGISHEWILANIPMDKTILEKILRPGYVDNTGQWHPTERGIPQGGPISSVICNMVLDGLEQSLRTCSDDIGFVRYADDILVVGKSQSDLVQAVMPVIEEFLRERGLSLSKEKSGLRSVYEGFSFLGCTFYKRGNDVIAEPSGKSVNDLLTKVIEVCDPRENMTDKARCNRLSQRIGGWVNYYAGIVLPQSLWSVEYTVETLVHGRDISRQLVGTVQKIFSNFESKYEGGVYNGRAGGL